MAGYSHFDYDQMTLLGIEVHTPLCRRAFYVVAQHDVLLRIALRVWKLKDPTQTCLGRLELFIARKAFFCRMKI